MPSPYHDLLIFDWANALSSTVLASRLLNVPQSTISRRVRAFLADHRLTIRRTGNGQKTLSPVGYLDDLRRLAQRYRVLHSELRWSAHPLWDETIRAEDDHLGQYLNLLTITPDELSGVSLDLNDWLENRLLDAHLDARLSQVPSASSTQLGILVPTPNDPKTRSSVHLGLFSSLAGIEDALTSLGWTIWTGPDRETLPLLTLMPRQPSEPVPGLLPLALHVQPHWRYSPSLQLNDPHTAGGIRQFEAHLAIVLSCLNDGQASSAAPIPIESDPLFAFSPLP